MAAGPTALAVVAFGQRALRASDALTANCRRPSPLLDSIMQQTTNPCTSKKLPSNILECEIWYYPVFVQRIKSFCGIPRIWSRNWHLWYVKKLSVLIAIAKKLLSPNNGTFCVIAFPKTPIHNFDKLSDLFRIRNWSCIAIHPVIVVLLLLVRVTFFKKCGFEGLQWSSVYTLRNLFSFTAPLIALKVCFPAFIVRPVQTRWLFPF